MNAVRRLARLGVVMIVAIAGLVPGGAPAFAAGTTRYMNVGNPTWCLDGNGTAVYLHRCGESNHQIWYFTDGDLQRLKYNNDQTKCLTVEPFIYSVVALRPCTASGVDQLWKIWGQNGWVVFEKPGVGLCAVPWNTDIVQGTYEIRLRVCPPDNNVDNIFAWHYYQY